MRRYMFIAFALTLFLIPGISSAQMQGGGKGQGMMGQGPRLAYALSPITNYGNYYQKDIYVSCT